MGKFLDPLGAVLSSRSKVRLLRTLLVTSQPLSGPEAARLAGVGRVPAARSLDELVALGIVHRGETSHQHLYRINRDSQLVQAGLTPLYAAERERLDSVFAWLRAALEAASEGEAVLGAWIFGSAARGEDTRESDLDVLVVVADAAAEDQVHRFLVNHDHALEERFGLRLSPVVIPRDRLRAMHDAGHELVADVLRDGRRVIGPDLARVLR
jgi:predicted nucleotidyltransferase